MIYLDNASTTQMDIEVYKEMEPYLLENFGNPSSIHDLGVKSRNAIDLARERVAKAINASPEEIIFTSGGSEANNFMANSLLFSKVLSSITEHDSMKNSLEHYHNVMMMAKPEIADIEILAPDFEALSFMYVNNELGFVNPVYRIGRAKKVYGFKFITDCVQALGSEEIDVKNMHCDMASFSSHKIHGPKGVGAVYISKQFKKEAEPLIYGGSNQEFGLRGGTENVAGIVGFGKACELINIDRNKTTISSLRKVFLESLKREFSGKKQDFRVNFDRNDSKIISLTFKNIDAETLVLLASSRGIYISAGSACKSLEQKPNEVLLAAGFSESEARSTVRISLSCYNTIEEVICASEIICDCVSVLSSLLD